MDQLPDLALLKIISYLDLNKQFKLRSINKRWKSLIEFSAKDKKSIFVYDKIYSNQERWSSDYEKVDNRDIVNLFFFKYFCLENNYFPNITKLFLYKIVSASFETKEQKSKLNDFIINIKELSIDILNPYLDYYAYKLVCEIIDFKNLHLQNLKVFSIKELFLDNEILKVNAPNLEKFTILFPIFAYEKKIILSYPESIKVLECQDFNINGRNFHNLEYLICDNLNSDFNVSNYTKLKKLELYPNYQIRTDFFFQNLFRQKLKYNLEILIFGYKFETMNDDLKEILRTFGKSSISSGLSEYIKVHPHIDTNYFKKNIQLYYEQALIIDNIFLPKIDIHKLWVVKLENFKNLAEFLNKIGGIKELHLNRCILNTENIKYLKSVLFIYHLYTFRCKIDESFDFIGEIKYLNYIHFSTDIYSIEEAKNLISCIKKFNIDRYHYYSPDLAFENCDDEMGRAFYLCIKNEYRQFKSLDEIYSEINKL